LAPAIACLTPQPPKSLACLLDKPSKPKVVLDPPYLPPFSLAPLFSSPPQLSSWREYYVLLGRQAPSDAALSDLLRWAWAAGAAKGYHSADTDFSRVQASGVSTILLKGQSYSMPPSAKSGAWGLGRLVVRLGVSFGWVCSCGQRVLFGWPAVWRCSSCACLLTSFPPSAAACVDCS
jgi:hypothetical protein